MSDDEIKKEMLDGKPEQLVLDNLGYMIHENCKKYAIAHMVDDDFILLSDANNIPTENIKMRKGDDGDLYTIKKSSKEKFDEFYNNKLQNIIEKLLKEND